MSAHVDVDDRVPVRVVLTEHRRSDDPGIGEVQIDPAEAVVGEVDERTDSLDR